VTNRTIKYRLNKTIRNSFGSALFIIYCFSVLQYTVQIDHSHKHDIKCDADNSKFESDPCHRSLIHHDEIHGCKHATHLINTSKHCSLCDILLHYDYVALIANHSGNKFDFIVTEIKYLQSNISESVFYFNSRGPPSQS
jgi:hypothetical protein